MDTAKDKIQKIVRPNEDTTNKQDKPGLERDLANKPTKVHLQSNDPNVELEPYHAIGKLKGKNAVVTGGDSGVGRSVAILFAMEGATVTIIYLPEEEADAQHTKAQVEKNGGQVLLVPSDLSKAINCKDVAARVGSAMSKVDVLVNNAATRNEDSTIGSISELSY